MGDCHVAGQAATLEAAAVERAWRRPNGGHGIGDETEGAGVGVGRLDQRAKVH